MSLAEWAGARDIVSAIHLQVWVSYPPSSAVGIDFSLAGGQEGV